MLLTIDKRIVVPKPASPRNMVCHSSRRGMSAPKSHDVRFHGNIWKGSNAISTVSAKQSTKSSASNREMKRASPVRTRAVADHLEVKATSAQAALERKSGKSTTVIPINHENDVLPPHIKSILKLLHGNVGKLEKFLANITRWTSSEVHAANSKISAMLTSQKTALDDLALFCNQEARYSGERVADLAAQVRESEADVSMQVLTLRFLYNILNNVANICNAQEGLLFLFPTGTARDSTAGDDAEHQTGRAEDRSLLMLAAHVSASAFSPLADGSTHSDIYELCQAVARSSCAVNFTAKTTGTPMNFDTIIACPLLMPQRPSVCLGVLCLVNKVSPYGETRFAQVDESRIVAAAEHMAESAASLPLNVAQSSTLVLSPSTWQQEYKRWRGARNEGTGVGGALREGVPTQFIFRSEYSGTALSKMNFKSRNAIEPGEVMLDVLGRYKNLEAQLDVANKRVNQALGRVTDAEDRLLSAKDETRKAVKDAHDMRIANERVLRTAVFNTRNVGMSGSETAARSPRMAQPDGPRDAPTATAAVVPNNSVERSPRQGTGSAKVPGRFVHSAQSSRMKSFFPSPPTAWNSKAKAVGGKPFLEM